MGFSQLENPKKTTGALRLKTTAARGRMSEGEGTAKLAISFPLDRFPNLLPGEPDYVQAFLGDGEDAGKLLLLPAQEGLGVAALKYVYTIRVPGWPDLPKEKFDCIEPEHEIVEHEGKQALLIHLPEWAWKPEVAASVLRARRANEHEAAALKQPPAGNGARPANGAAAGLNDDGKHVLAALQRVGEKTFESGLVALARAATVPEMRMPGILAELSKRGLIEYRAPAKPGRAYVFTMTGGAA